MSERKYSDEEVRAIIGRAAENDGLTLAEIQSIAKEVGIDADDVARAAATLRAAPMEQPPSRFEFKFMPTRVAHTVPLSRAMTDAEWDHFVVILRDIFGAKGKVSSTGSIREWSNSNLRVSVEPIGAGYRVRMSTRKGNAAILNTMAVVGFGAGAFAVAGGLLSRSADALINAGVFFSLGAGAFVSNILRLPPWAARRREQMERAAEEAKQIIG